LLEKNVYVMNVHGLMKTINVNISDIMGLLDLLGCKHEYIEVGRYKKLKCNKCQSEIMVKENDKHE
jgi:uncharacterized protein (UPF0212 family)